MHNNQLWYTRRDNEIRGPFPSGLITRYILLGRVREEDELSTDQIDWQRVVDLPDLIPEELKLDLSMPENIDRLRIARMREDEREAGDRRVRQLQQGNAQHKYHNRGTDRRKQESDDVIRHREIKSQLLNSLRKKQKQTYLPRFLAAMFVLVMVCWIVFSST